jgi:hypothetical protein
MSNLKQFTSKIENVSSGEIISALEFDSNFYLNDGFLKCDGSVLQQNTYPYLYENIGNFFDNLDISTNAVTSNTVQNINALAYANNTFVYAGNGGVLATSTNGVDWTPQTSGTTSNINTLAYGNGTFVYASSQFNARSTNNGITWSAVDNSAIYVGGKTFDRAGNTSTTNISLTNLTGGANTAPLEGDLVVIAVATGSDVNQPQTVTDYTQIASLYSNGENRDTNLWVGYKVMGSTPDTTVTIPGTGTVDDAQTVAIHVWRNLRFVNGTTNISTTSAIPNPPSITVSEANSVVLVVGAGAHDSGIDTFSASYANNFITTGSNDSDDSTIGMGSVDRPTPGVYDPPAFTFSASDDSDNSCAAVTILLAPNAQINFSTYGNGTFVYAGEIGFLATSTDGITLTKRTSGTTSNINALTYGNEGFVYAGDGGILATSIDGINWTARTSGTTSNINALTYGNGIYVYAGDGGVLRTSTNGITWTARTSGTTSNIKSIAYLNGIFIYSSDTGVLSTSPDGITWTARTSGTASSINALTYGDKKIVFAGANGLLRTYIPYTHDVTTEFVLPTTNTYFGLYIKT